MQELLEKIRQMYTNGETPVDSEDRIVYEFVAIFQLDEGVEYEEAIDILVDRLYGKEGID